MKFNLGKSFSDFIIRVGDVLWPKMIAARKADIQSSFSTTEKGLIIVISYIIALGLWVMVNLDYEYNLNLKLQLTSGEIAEGLALVAPLPESIDVSVSGVGWNLLNLYNSPPEIPVNLAEEFVDMTQQVATVISGYQNISLIRVQPTILNVDVEQRVSKKVPVQLSWSIDFMDQFNLVGKPLLRPDSVVVSGAVSRVDTISVWPTMPYSANEVRENISSAVKLISPPNVISLSHTEIMLTARVSEYTEGELRLPLVIRGLPRGREVVFNPSTITIRYSVPIDFYQRTKEVPPFGAFVDYDDLINNTTGLVTPEVEFLIQAPDISLKSIQPRTISYFIVVTN